MVVSLIGAIAGVTIPSLQKYVWRTQGNYAYTLTAFALDGVPAANSQASTSGDLDARDESWTY